MQSTVDAGLNVNLRVHIPRAYLLQSVEQVMRAVEQAAYETMLQCYEWNLTFVPIDRGDLRRSFEIEKGWMSNFEYFLKFIWGVEYASYLYEKGKAGTAKARTPGTTLLYPEVMRDRAIVLFESKLRRYLADVEAGKRRIG